jgi:hypothetical protein
MATAAGASLEIVARVEGSPPALALVAARPVSSELDRLRAIMGDPALSPGKRSFLVQQFRVSEALAHKEVDDYEILNAFLERIFLLQREYLLSRQEAAWADVPLGTLASDLGCPLITLTRILKERGIAVGTETFRLDDLVGVERHARTAKDLDYARPETLVPTDHVRSRAVLDALVDVFQAGRQAILDPVLVVPHPTDGELGYVCEGNHRAAAAHVAKAKVRIRILKSKESFQFFLSGTSAARMAEASDYASFVSVCAEQAARLGYQAGSWDKYLNGLLERPDTSHAVRILNGAPGLPLPSPEPPSPDDTTSDALRGSILELFEGLPERDFSAKEVEERLLLMGVPRRVLPKPERLEVYLRHVGKVREISPGRFGLKG